MQQLAVSFKSSGIKQVVGFQSKSAANKAQQSDLGKLSPFLRAAKMPPSHPNRSAQRWAPFMRTLAILSILFASYISGAHGESKCALFFPSALVSDTQDLQIEELTISIACGEVRAVHSIPSDWNLEVIRPISAVGQLNASPGHGYAQSIRELQGVIILGGASEKCFAISMNLIAYGPFAGEFRFQNESATNPTDSKNPPLECRQINE